MYKNFIKRLLDFMTAFTVLGLLLPLLAVLSLAGLIAMGGNPFFFQYRPGKKDKNGNEKIFRIVKFRTMSNARDKNGNLLPDKVRLNVYGRFLRKTSLDELPELWNILVGDMSLVGPRPQLVKDMTFMTTEQRRRHDVRPGLTGLAQINGRNNITWEQKLAYDLQYIDNGITFWGDMKIIFRTVVKVIKSEDVVREGTVSDMDFGDWLMEKGAVDREEYDKKQIQAKDLLGDRK